MGATHIDFGIVGRTRGEGRAGSAVAASAYNRCTQDGGFDFSRKFTEHGGGCVLLPPGSPPALSDAAALWRAAESAERRADAQLARQITFAIPRECPPELRLDLARAVAAPWVADGAGVQIDIHVPTAADGGEQPHAHLLTTLRRVTEAGLAATKERTWNAAFRAGEGQRMREAIATRCNDFLATHGCTGRLEHRSHAESGQRNPPEPTAPRRDWQRWLRDGANPTEAPITVAHVLAHRGQRAELQETEKMADAAADEVAALTAALASPDPGPAPPMPPPPPPRPDRVTRTEAATARQVLSAAWDAATAALAGQPPRPPAVADLTRERVVAVTDRRDQAQNDADRANAHARATWQRTGWIRWLVSATARRTVGQVEAAAAAARVAADRICTSYAHNVTTARASAARDARTIRATWETWRRSEPVTAAIATRAAVVAARAAVNAGNVEVTRVVAQGTIPPEVAATAAPQPVNPVQAALDAEKTAARDPVQLAAARRVTAAVMARDIDTITAVQGGHHKEATAAAVAWRPATSVPVSTVHALPTDAPWPLIR